MNMKWNKLNKKKPKVGQKVIWKGNDNGYYPIYYGTYLGIMEIVPNTNYYVYTFKMWFDSNLTTYDIKTKDIVWIPYPTGED